MRISGVIFSGILAAGSGLVLILPPLAGQIQQPNPMGLPGGTATPGSPNFGGNMPGAIDGNRTGPIMLTGKVVLSDGASTSEPIRIERVCTDRNGGRPQPAGFTDSKGRFTITLGQDRDIMPDASEASRSGLGTNSLGGINPAEFTNCELRAVLPGYRSETIPLQTRRYMDNPDVGTILLHRMANVEGSTISATSALAPKDARKAYEKGMEEVRKNKLDEAQKEFEKAVAAYPKYAAAWFELGQIQEQRDHPDEARKAYAQAIAADSKYINPSERLYLLDAKEKKWPEAAEASDRVLHLNPVDFPGAYYWNAVANLELGNLDAAEKSGREAVQRDAAHQNPRANYVLGIILARKSEWGPAAECLRAFLEEAPGADDADKAREQLAQMEKAAGGHPQ